MRAKLKFIIPIAIAVIAIITAAFCINFTPRERADIASLMSTAQKYLIENQYEQAIAEFEKVIELEPKNVDAYLGLAEAYVKMGDTDKAAEVLKKGYDITGDERLKKALNDLLNGSGTDNNAEAASAETPSSETSETTAEEEELFEVEQETVSFIVPYKIEKSGEEFYCYYNIDTVCYDDFIIDHSEFMNDVYYTFRMGDMGCPDDLYNMYNVMSISLGEDISPYLNLYSCPQNDFKYNKPQAILPAASLYHTDGTPILSVKDKYNKDSQLVKREHYAGDDLEYGYNYTYNKNGQVTAIGIGAGNSYFKYDSNWNIIEINHGSRIEKYEYDSNGNLLKEMTDSDHYTEYTYDSNGNCLTMNEYYYGDLRYSYNCKYDSNDNLIEYTSTNTDEMDIIKFDSEGNVIEVYSEHYNSSAADSHSKYEYDNDGKLIKVEDEFYFKDDNISNQQIATYQYDTDGKLIGEIFYVGEGLTDTYSYIYNSDGLLQEIKLSSTNAFHDDLGYTTKYQYKYDSQGNRTKCDYYYDDEWKGSEECTEFIKIEIPKEVFDDVFNK